VGLTGTPEEIASVAKTYRVFFSRVDNSAPDTYLMDHSTIMYLMDPQGRFLKHFSYTTDAPALAKALGEAVTP
jgi:cytochrome oxidase Cu insertion factor (SCO1/SenC/PrrC family)